MGSETEIRVRVVKEEMVRPATREKLQKKEGGEEMFLSGIDIMCRQMPHNRRLLFYEHMGMDMGMGMGMDNGMDMGMGKHKDMDMDMGMDMVATLKQSLALALDAFYPLASRLLNPGDGSRLRLDCNDSGVAFLEATVDGGVTLADLRRDGAFSGSQPPFFDQLVPKVNPIDYASVPPLLIQVSRFDCGGIALGIAQSHVICDGTSLWHFMNSWAECARGEPISMPPMHARSLLKVENPSTNKAMLNLEHVEDEERTIDKGNHIKLNTFRFRKGTIDMLKTKVHGKNTSYETICAHIWKHTTKARRHMRDKKVGFISIVNMRRRVEPPLGDAFFGNALMWTIAVATVGELEDEDLAATTQRIHRSIRACNNDAFYSFLYWLEVYDRDAIFKTCMLNGARIRASSSPNFPIFKLDFGWGKPYVARCPSAEDAGKIIFFPGSDVRGNIDVVLALPMEIMQRLESDEAFTNP